MADEEKKPHQEADQEANQFGIDQRRMPFTAHLAELRNRLLICLIAVAVTFFVFFFLAGRYLFAVLELPVKAAAAATGGKVDYDDLLISLTPVSTFLTSAVVSLLAAVAVTAPVTIYEIWAFAAPGLKRRERRAVIPILSLGTILFAVGVLFAYFVVLRFVLTFLIKYTLNYGVKPTWNISQLIKFEAVMMLVFGLAFELPLVVVALTKVGVVTPEALARKRRHAIVIMFIGAALLTPPDVISQICLGLPLVALYEISIQAARFFRPKGSYWDRWDKWEEEEGGTGRETPRPAGPSDEGGAGAQIDTEQPEAEQGEGEYDEDYYADEYDAESDEESGYTEEEQGEQEEEQGPPAEEGKEEAEGRERAEEGREDLWGDDLPPDALMH